MEDIEPYFSNLAGMFKSLSVLLLSVSLLFSHCLLLSLSLSLSLYQLGTDLVKHLRNISDQLLLVFAYLFLFYIISSLLTSET